MHKKALYLSFMVQNVQKMSFLMQNNPFLRAPHQIAASAYLMRDYAVLR